MLPVGRNSVTFIRDIKEIKGAKRLRVELFPHGISLFYDFSRRFRSLSGLRLR
jgi:hypothetical protein